MKNFVRFIVFAIFAISNTACIPPFIKHVSEAERREIENTPPPFKPIKPLPNPQYVQKFSATGFDLTTVYGEFQNQVFTQLNKENFSWLEKTASKARNGKERLKGGYWTIRAFYGGILPKNNTDEEYKRLFEKLNRWKNIYPRSVTPRIAIAEAWKYYAGEARGNGYANTVSAEGWQLFKERMLNSKNELIEAKKLTERCPYWYLGMMEIAKNEGWELNDFEVLYQEAIAFEPDFYYYYQEKGAYLLPRWSGTPQQWEAYVHGLFEEHGATIYYLTLSHFVLEYGGIDFDYRKFAPEKAKKGFEEFRKTFGVDKTRLNQFAKFSVFANDFPSAAGAFKEIGDDLDVEVWGTKNMFESCRQIAIEGAKANSLNNL